MKLFESKKPQGFASQILVPKGTKIISYRFHAQLPNGDVGLTAWYTKAVSDDIQKEIIASGAKIIKTETKTEVA